MDIEDEFIKILVEKIYREKRWFLELSKKHSVSAKIMNALLTLLEDSPSMKKEGQKIRFGIVFNPGNVIFEDGELTIKEFLLLDSKKILDLQNIADGTHLCYVLDNNTGMLSLKKIPSELKRKTCTETFQFISEVFNTACFFVNDYVRVFDSGKAVKIFRRGNWLSPCEVNLKDLDFPYEILRCILKFSIDMSESKKDGCFVIQKTKNKKYLIPLLEYSSIKSDILSVDDEFLMKYTSFDGAIVIHENGKIIGVSQNLCPPTDTYYEEEVGRGTKHNSACQFTGACKSVAFVISKDGPISIYTDGKLYCRCFGELFFE